MKKMLGIACVSAAALLLAACGSSDDGSAAPVTPPTPVVTTDVPTSAQQSSSGLTAYLNALIAATSESGDPIVLGDATLTADDTTETSL